MIFIDASAIIAAMTVEDDAEALTLAIESNSQRLTSPIAVFEAVLGVCRKRHGTVLEATDDVHEFLRIVEVELVPIEAGDERTALDAHARFGKGRGHPAKLNLGDCFAYAMAMNRGATLLLKGDDFQKTDVCGYFVG